VLEWTALALVAYWEGPGFISRLGHQVISAVTRSFYVVIRDVLISQSLTHSMKISMGQGV